MATVKRKLRKQRAPVGGRIGRRTGALLALAVIAGLLLLRGPLVERARAGTAYAARIGCSCHFVTGRALGQCRADFERGMGWVMLSADEAGASVTARVPLLAEDTARWRKNWGCVLDPWRD